MIALICIFILAILFLSFLVILEQIDFAQVKAQQQPAIIKQINNCIRYNVLQRSIIISCKSATLTDVFNQLNNPSILNKQPQGVWLLNANMTIQPGASLTIDPKDTTWLKIMADEKTLAYGIHIMGALKIDSVKVTSWNPQTNNYAMSYGYREKGNDLTTACGYYSCPINVKDTLTHKGAPRPYLIIEHNATGTTNITNSYIGYLGYEAGWSKSAQGLHYNAGDGSVIRNNDIDHLYFGFYSRGVSNILIENNQIHNSGQYGIDPHTGTHDMVIRNNTVYNTNGTAIICSLDCYRILFDGNNVHDNKGIGIHFSRNTTNSIAKNNKLNNQETPIELSSSNNNEVYNNEISKTTATPGITLKDGASGNKIHDNTFANIRIGILIHKTSINNSIYSNKISNINQQPMEIIKSKE